MFLPTFLDMGMTTYQAHGHGGYAMTNRNKVISSAALLQAKGETLTAGLQGTAPGDYSGYSGHSTHAGDVGRLRPGSLASLALTPSKSWPDSECLRTAALMLARN